MKLMKIERTSKDGKVIEVREEDDVAPDIEKIKSKEVSLQMNVADLMSKGKTKTLALDMLYERLVTDKI